jgi:hypothetical protein
LALRLFGRSWQWAAICLPIVLLATAGAQHGRSQSGDPATPEQPGAGAADLRYEIAVEGVDDDALRQLLEDVSETKRLIDRPPPSLARLRRRAEDDKRRSKVWAPRPAASRSAKVRRTSASTA